MSKRESAAPRTLVDVGLEAMANAELGRGGFGLAFPPPLESRYKSDIAAERAREIRILAQVGALLYVSCSLLLQMFVSANPTWRNTFIQTLSLLAMVLVFSHFFFRAKTADAVREGAVLLCCLTSSLASILLVYISPAHMTTQDFVLAALPANFTLMFVRLRFPAAAGFVAVTVAAYVAAVLLRHDIAPHDCVFPIAFMATLCLPALIGVHAYERASRRNYLHGLLQRLHNESLAAENTTLADMSMTDGLTQVANRRRLDAELRVFCEMEQAEGALLLIDIDRFKQLNDQHGHQAGDACLRQVAQCLAAQLRQCDLLARFGGEEFAVLLPGLPVLDCVQVAERLRRAIEEQGFVAGRTRTSMTVSVGVAMRSSGILPEALISAADKALYAAKNSGRNRVSMADERLVA